MVRRDGHVLKHFLCSLLFIILSEVHRLQMCHESLLPLKVLSAGTTHIPIVLLHVNHLHMPLGVLEKVSRRSTKLTHPVAVTVRLQVFARICKEEFTCISSPGQ